MSLTIWTNLRLTGAARAELMEHVRPHRLLEAGTSPGADVASGASEADLGEADIVFGQPDPDLALQCTRLRWIHVSAAGYTRYDGAAFRQAFARRGAMLTNSSAVYAEPCAEQVLAFMLAQARQLPPSLETQRTDRAWPMHERRAATRLLRVESALLLGFGAIGRRLAELLAPFHMVLSALRRRTEGDQGIAIIQEQQLAQALGSADHVINILPENSSTISYMNAERFAAIKPGAIFYNIGRGSTVDQEALLAALESGRLKAAYLDVTSPEPLPPEHALWSAPNCFITPHIAGGHADEPQRLVRHFIENLRRFEKEEPLLDRVI